MAAELIEKQTCSGTRKASFTGAASRHVGKFEQANHGTLLLDEIGEMPILMLAKLLRVLEEGQVERVGGDRTIPVDVRVIVATHRNLPRPGEEGRVPRGFVSPHLRFPTLRCRRCAIATGEIPALVKHFAAQVCEVNGWKPKVFLPEAIQELQRYSWPGNVRELRNMVERLLLLADGAVDAALVRLALPARRRGSAGDGARYSLAPLAERTDSFRTRTDSGGVEAPSSSG